MHPTASQIPLSTLPGDAEPDDLDIEVEERHLEIPAELHRQRLDRALVQLMPEFSRNHLKHLIEDGYVSSNVSAMAENMASKFSGPSIATKCSSRGRPHPSKPAVVRRTRQRCTQRPPTLAASTGGRCAVVM